MLFKDAIHSARVAGGTCIRAELLGSDQDSIAPLGVAISLHFDPDPVFPTGLIVKNSF